MRFAGPAAILAVLVLLSGCGDSSDETTSSRASSPGDATERVQSAFERSRDCRTPSGASRWGCSVGSYRCQGVVTGRGWSVSCAKPGESIAFLIRRD